MAFEYTGATCRSIVQNIEAKFAALTDHIPHCTDSVLESVVVLSLPKYNLSVVKILAIIHPENRLSYHPRSCNS